MPRRDRRNGRAPAGHLAEETPARGGDFVSAPEVVFDEVSKFYGEVLGVNSVTLRIPSGITSLVGPNGSGKTTLMNLMVGLIFPDSGTITMRGLSPRDTERLMRITGYATQYDAAPRGTTGFDFVATGLLLAGYSSAAAAERAEKALQRVRMTRSEEHTSELQSRGHLVCRLLLEKKKSKRKPRKLRETVTLPFAPLH